MIEFVTLFLGLIGGPQTVALQCDATVVAVELQLDGGMAARLDAAGLEEWRRAQGRPTDAPLDSIRAVLLDPDLWRSALDRGEASVPVNDADYQRGFCLAYALVGAGEVPSAMRAGWPPDVRDFSASDWLKDGGPPRTARTREGLFNRLREEGASLGHAQASRRGAPDWATWMNRVAHVVAQATP